MLAEAFYRRDDFQKAAASLNGVEVSTNKLREPAPMRYREPLPGTPNMPGSGGGRIGSVLVTMDRR